MNITQEAKPPKNEIHNDARLRRMFSCLTEPGVLFSCAVLYLYTRGTNIQTLLQVQVLCVHRCAGVHTEPS